MEYQAMNCDAFAMFSLDEAGKRNNSNEKYFSNIDFSFDFQDLNLKKSRNKTNFNNCCVVERLSGSLLH
jgi:hypothetical protein